MAKSPSYTSTKLLLQLVTEQAVSASDEVLQEELDTQASLLEKGIDFFAPSTKSTRDAFLAKRAKQAKGKLTQFILMLSQLLNVEEELSKQILSAYLSGEFRGTKESLKKLIEEDRFQRPLLQDIWQFYRAERLHLLKVLKEIICNSENEENAHKATFAKTLNKLRHNNGFRTNLVSQMESVMTEKPPTKESHGKHFTEQNLISWAHFNLREQSELLQLNLLNLYHKDMSMGSKIQSFIELYQLFINNGFGHRQNCMHVISEINQDLVDSIGFLQSLTLIYLIDLPSICEKGENSWKNMDDDISKVNKLVGSLGNADEHGPIMLTWMLAHYLCKGEGSMAKYQYLGERALQLRAISFLDKIITNEVVISNVTISKIAAGISYSLLSVLVSAFEPQRMGLVTEVQLLSEHLLSHEVISTNFWKQGFDSGLGTHFSALLTNFPEDMNPFLRISTELAKASEESATFVIRCIEDMNVFAEPLDLVPFSQLQAAGQERFKLLRARFPCSTTQEVYIPPNTVGTSDGRLIKWQIRYNGWRYLKSEMEKLDHQMIEDNVEASLINKISHIASLLHAVISSNPEGKGFIDSHFTEICLRLTQKLVKLYEPHVALLTHLLNFLSVIGTERPNEIWHHLEKTGLFPSYVSHGSSEDQGDLQSGVIGSLLARHECISGEYPLTTAFLDLLRKLCFNNAENIDESEMEINESDQTQTTLHPAATSVQFVLLDMFPSFQQWQFTNQSKKEELGQKMLGLFKDLLSLPEAPKSLQNLVCQGLVQAAPISTLLKKIATGDKVIRSLIEAQSSWETGVGVELCRTVNVAVQLFNALVVKTDLSKLEAINRLLCSPPPTGKQHFLLTLMHYVYLVQSFSLPISVLKVLETIARTFPMSMLACLGNDAEAVRDILIFRLESRTENSTFKVAVLDFFSACVDAQPGLIQLLIGAKDVQMVAASTKKDDDKKIAESNELVGENGCLTSVIAMLKEFKGGKKPENKINNSLHLSLINFVLNLWYHQRLIAMAHLKHQSDFWEDLSFPLFKEISFEQTELNGMLLHLLSLEIYTFKGQIDDGLRKVLEKFCDSKQPFFSNWYSHVLGRIISEPEEHLYEGHHKEQYILSDLFGCWKTFMTVLTRDQPINLSPSHCQLLSSKLIKSIRGLFEAEDGLDDPNRITSLCELCLMLMVRWQTKCADNMEDWCHEQAKLLVDLSREFDHLHPRARAALLGIANTTLKISHFKLTKDADVLGCWLEPTGIIIQKSFASYEKTFQKTNLTFKPAQIPILALNLFHGLIKRIGDSKIWFDELHKQVLVQACVYRLHENVRLRQDEDLVQSILGLLLQVANSQVGCHALLSSDLPQYFWLTLADFGRSETTSKEWMPVFELTIQLSATLLRIGKYDALDSCVTMVALLQGHLTTFLQTIRDSVRQEDIGLAVTTASFIASLMRYHKQWHLQHPSTLLHFYRTMCELIHVSICLLLRPSLLGMLVSRSKDHKTNVAKPETAEQRVRRMSSTDQEVEVCAPETVSVQDSLLDCLNAGLSMLRRLSPDIIDLAAGNVQDIDEYEKLLGIGFSSPTFEQEGGLTFGTIISISNICTRSVTRGDRSPSPASRQSSTSLQTPTPPSPQTYLQKVGQMDRKRLVQGLEQSLVILLSQAILYFADPRITQRDNQLLRRELGAELSSCIESMRRYVHRGLKSPQTVRSGSSPTSSPGGGSNFGPRLAKSDEQFMKVISNIVQSVFQ